MEIDTYTNSSKRRKEGLETPKTSWVFLHPPGGSGLWPWLDNPTACQVTGEKDCNLVELARSPPVEMEGLLTVELFCACHSVNLLKVVGLEVAWRIKQSGQSRAPSLQVNPRTISKIQIARENNTFLTIGHKKPGTTWLLVIQFSSIGCNFSTTNCEVGKSWGTYTIEEAGEIPLDDLSGSMGFWLRSSRDRGLTNYNPGPPVETFQFKIIRNWSSHVWNCWVIGLIHS